MPAATTSPTHLASEILAIVGGDPTLLAAPVGLNDLFLQASRKQLLDCATRLGLNEVSKLSTEDLAGRIQVAFAGLATTSSVAANGSFPQKFDLGPGIETAAMPQDIPWGYSQDRVTGMVVDPDRLYVYWEVTDDAIAAARTGLGASGPNAWLNLRVYDITARLFDGTNAHSYFDHRVDRHERQWFFAINKPTSTACVEIGLKSAEGYFVKISRSGRVDFPRREPVGGGPVEWLSVRGASGPVGGAVTGAPPTNGAAHGAPGGGPGGGGPAGGGPGGGGTDADDWQDWTQFAGFPIPAGQRLFGRRWQRHEGTTEQWTTEWTRTEWAGPVLRSEWEAGPFTYPIEVPSGSVEYQDNGEVSVRSEGGRTHIMYGPWQVVIRGIGARAEKRVLGSWEVRRQVEVTGGVERTFEGSELRQVGSSEWLLVGASERAWMGASELLYGGASEMWLLGASEVLLGGASEMLYSGASEFRYRGASERLLMGASERRLGGATERTFAGASENMYAGASERMLGGASEYQGASERFLGASEKVAGKAADGSFPKPGQGESNGSKGSKG
jgi:hypothetical protein